MNTNSATATCNQTVHRLHPYEVAMTWENSKVHNVETMGWKIKFAINATENYKRFAFSRIVLLVYASLKLCIFLRENNYQYTFQNCQFYDEQSLANMLIADVDRMAKCGSIHRRRYHLRRHTEGCFRRTKSIPRHILLIKLIRN